MDTEIIQNSSVRIPVRLLSQTSFTAITGSTSPTVFIHKVGSGSSYSYTVLLNTSWFEIDSVHIPGYYNLLLRTTDTDTLGQIVVSIKDTNSDYFVATYTVVASTTSTVNTSLQSINSTLGTNTSNVGNYNSTLSDYNSTLGTLTTNVGNYNTVLGNLNTSVGNMSSQFSTFNTSMTLLKKAALNRTRIDPDTHTFIIYNDDGTTPLKTFSLYDSTGSLSSSNIYDRRPQ